MSVEPTNFFKEYRKEYLIASFSGGTFALASLALTLFVALHVSTPAANYGLLTTTGISLLIFTVSFASLRKKTQRHLVWTKWKISPNNLKNRNSDSIKVPDLNDWKSVNISNIDQLPLVQSQELSNPTISDFSSCLDIDSLEEQKPSVEITAHEQPAIIVEPPPSPIVAPTEIVSQDIVTIVPAFGEPNDILPVEMEIVEPIPVKIDFRVEFEKFKVESSLLIESAKKFLQILGQAYNIDPSTSRVNLTCLPSLFSLLDAQLQEIYSHPRQLIRALLPALQPFLQIHLRNIESFERKDFLILLNTFFIFGDNEKQSLFTIFSGKVIESCLDDESTFFDAQIAKMVAEVRNALLACKNCPANEKIKEERYDLFLHRLLALYDSLFKKIELSEEEWLKLSYVFTSSVLEIKEFKKFKDLEKTLNDQFSPEGMFNQSFVTDKVEAVVPSLFKKAFKKLAASAMESAPDWLIKAIQKSFINKKIDLFFEKFPLLSGAKDLRKACKNSCASLIKIALHAFFLDGSELRKNLKEIVEITHPDYISSPLQNATIYLQAVSQGLANQFGIELA